MKKSSSVKNKLLLMVPASFFLVITFFLYGPLSLYLPNAQELWFGLGDIMKCVLPVSAAVFALLIILGVVLPEGISQILAKLVFGCALGLYLQGNLISIRYGSGVMDGSEIKWEHYTKYAIINTAVWILCLVLPFVISFIFEKAGKRKTSGESDAGKRANLVVIAASLFLSAIQLPAMAVELITYKPNEQELSITEENEFVLSDKKNTLLYVLDTVDEKYFKEFTEAYPEYTDELTGFVHYENTLASAARTMVALPSMLTGEPFRREMTYSQYLDQVYMADNPLLRMAENGTRVDIYSQTLYFSDQMTDYVDNFSKEKQKVGSYFTLLKKVYKLTMARFFPHLLKKYVWFDTAEFDQAKGGTSSYPENDVHFIRNFRSTGFSYNTDEESVFQLYHLFGTHAPYTLTPEGTRAEKTSVLDQMAGCMNAVSEMLNDLKQSGHYDDALIIITSDHGDKNLAQQPFLLIKQPGSQNAYSTSDIPVSLFDLPGILFDAFDYEYEQGQYGMTMEEAAKTADRERHFFHNQTGSSRLQIREYKTTSAANDYDAMELVTTFEDEAGLDTPYTLGTMLTFDAEATGNVYCTEGFGTNSGFRTVMTGPYAQLVIPIENVPEKGNLEVTIGIHTKSNTSDTIIAANGTEVFHDVVGKEYVGTGIVFSVPASLVKEADGILTLDFTFPEVSEDELQKVTEKRKRTLSLVSLCIQ